MPLPQVTMTVMMTVIVGIGGEGQHNRQKLTATYLTLPRGNLMLALVLITITSPTNLTGLLLERAFDDGFSYAVLP